MEKQSNQIEEIKSRLDVVDIVGKYVQLKQAGKNFSGLCPFHSEKTPSFIVSPELQRYKCFGCGETGDIFNFIQKVENIDFPETLEKLAKEAGVTLVKRNISTANERLEEINKLATIYFYKELNNPRNKTALEYVQNRGYSKDTIKSFGLGYAPGGSGLLDYIFKQKKFTKTELLNSGLFVEKESKLRSKFFKRVMFPIRSSSGRVIAFTGRILPSEDFGPKYMNSPETPIYHKKENFYGQYESRQEMRKNDLAILCEGTTDVISAHQAGIKNIVAPLGTALTKEQLSKISKYTKNVLFIFDSDQAGQTALERAFPIAQELGINAFAANTLPYKDLDELVKEDPKKLKHIIKHKVDAYTYLLTEYVKDKNMNKYEDHEKVLDWIKKTLGSVKNPSHLAFYVKKSLNITKIDIQDIPQLSKKKVLPKNFSQSSQPRSRENIYLQTLLFTSPLQLPHTHDIQYFESADIRRVLEFVKTNCNTTREEILKHFEKENKIYKLIEDAIFKFSESDTNHDELEELYRNILKEYFVRKEREINVKIAIAEETGNLKESEKLLQEFQKLSKQKYKYEKDS